MNFGKKGRPANLTAADKNNQQQDHTIISEESASISGKYSMKSSGEVHSSCIIESKSRSRNHKIDSNSLT